MKRILNNKILTDIIIMTLFIVFAGILSVKFGIERTWDTRNYHIYNPYAFLTGRLTTDIMPAGIQSYFNPLLDIPYYLFIKYFNNHPAFVTFIYGFSYALFLFIIYKISSFIFQKYNKIILTIISVIIASGSTMLIRITGWLSHDILVADLILISIYFLIKAFDNEKFKPANFIIAGLLVGAAAGFKLTAGIFALPLIITCLIFCKQFNSPLKSILVFLSSIALGFLITDGFWLAKMYLLFKNPFMPYFNWIFHSPIINTNEVYSVDFAYGIPEGLSQIIFFPFILSSELRFKLLWILFFINLITIPFVSKDEFKNKFNINIRYTDFLFIFTFFTYIIWIKSFAVYRYFCPLTGFCAIFTFIVALKVIYLLQKIFPKTTILTNENFQNSYPIIISIILFVTCLPNYSLQKETKLIRTPVGNKLFECADYSIPDNSIVLVQQGTAIFIPFLNPNARYIHLNAIHFSRHDITLLSDEKIKEIKNMLISNHEKIYFLTDMSINKTNIINLQEFLRIEKKLKDIEAKKVLLDKKLKNNIATPENIQEKNNLEKELKQLKSNETYKPALGYTELALDKLGIDLNKTECKLLENNIKNENPETLYKQTKFYICKIRLKNINSIE